MDAEEQILCLGIVVGWLITMLSTSIVGALNGMDEIILMIMIGVSAGILVGLFLLSYVIVFFLKYKIVRRD